MLRHRLSLTIPIVLGILSVALTIALLVGWILVVVQNLSFTERVVQNAWLLALGSVSFLVITTVLVLFSIFLVREIRVVHRQTRFIDSVTHELKSPLTSIKLCLETLARGDLPASQHDRLRRMMVDDVERLSILIDHVLEASRVSHSRDTHTLEEVPLHGLVSSCAEVILRHYREPAEAIRVEIPADLTVVSDRMALETVVKNLLDNAVKYSRGLERPVEVSVLARGDGRHVELEVRDGGIGIQAKDLKRVAERFYRSPDEAVRARRGTGLGLYVVSILVRLLGGRLRVHSDGLDRGTVVRVRIPTRRGPASAPSTDRALERSPA